MATAPITTIVIIIIITTTTTTSAGRYDSCYSDVYDEYYCYESFYHYHYYDSHTYLSWKGLIQALAAVVPPL